MKDPRECFTAQERKLIRSLLAGAGEQALEAAWGYVFWVLPSLAFVGCYLHYEQCSYLVTAYCFIAAPMTWGALTAYRATGQWRVIISKYETAINGLCCEGGISDEDKPRLD